MTYLKPAETIGRKFQNPLPTAVGGLSVMVKVLPELIRSREERVPKRPLGPFRTDSAIYQTPPPTGLRVTWLGHSVLLIELDGLRILIDPVWDKRASPFSWLGPKRFFPAPLPLAELPPLDAILISHDHYDHLGEATVRRLATLPGAANARWVTSIGVGAILHQFGVPAAAITELDWTQSVSINAFTGKSCTITSLPARHFSGRSLANRFETLWASFVLRGPAHTIYYGADSGHWPGFAEIGAAHGPFDVTMLEIGASNDLWRQIHLGPDCALEAFQAMGAAGLLMPIHWGLFDLALHGWRQPIERLTEIAAAANIKLWSPEPGCPTDVHPGVELLSPWWRRP